MSDEPTAAQLAIGDINNDGVNDLIIGSKNEDTGAGKTYLLFGKDTTAKGDYATNILTSEFDGSIGFTIKGIDEQDLSGYDVAGAGDINGDGIDDIIIGSEQGSNDASLTDRPGSAYVIFGYE